MSDFATCCILSYNRPKFLRQCLSTLTQNADYPFELIVQDDGSTDEYLLDYLGQLHREGLISTLILNPPGHNQGQGTALNRMFGMARGDPIIKLDHDLVFRPGWLKTTVEILDRNEERSFGVEGPGPRGHEKVVPVDEREPRIGLLSGFRYEHDPCDWRKTLSAEYKDWQEHEIILGSFMAIRRETWEGLGPFEEHSDAFAEDNVFQHKVTDSGVWVCGTPVPDVCDNVGFGVGPSTVVVDHGVVAKIHHEPLVFGR